MQSAVWTPDLHWLTDHLAVGGRFPIARSQSLKVEHQIDAVVDLRGETCDDPSALEKCGIEFLHLPTPDMESASITMLDEGVRFTRDRIAEGKRVLIHCQHGIGRSALLALCVLVDQGWDPLQALEHAKSQRRAVSPSEAQYQGWVRWLRSHGKAAPDYHSFGCIAYRHLSGG